MSELRKCTDKEGRVSSDQSQSLDQKKPIQSQHKLKKEGSASESGQKYFPLFSQSIDGSSEVKRERGKNRKPAKQKSLTPPTFNHHKISKYFSPKIGTKLPNEREDEERRGHGE